MKPEMQLNLVMPFIMIHGGNMKKFMFIGKYWIPFPSSEYGGSWSVIASDKTEVATLLRDEVTDYYIQYDENMLESIEKSQYFELAGEPESKVIDTFFT
jgi:hypothetical protein